MTAWFPRRFALAASVALGLAAPAAAQAPEESAEDFVRSLYDEPVYNPLEEEAEGPTKLTGDALEALRASRRESEESEGVGCIDFVVTVSGQDYDEAEIRRTLEVVPAGIDPEWPLEPGEARVLASFRSFPGPDAETTTLFYDLLTVDGAWRIADIANTAEEGWTMSQLCR